MSRWAATVAAAAARGKGVTFGRPTKLNAKQRGMLAERYAKGETMAALAREFDVSEPTVWRALRKFTGGKSRCRVTDQSPTQTNKPWPREKLDLHVTQRIREQVDVALVLYRNDDDGLEAMLREGGEDAVWRVVQEAIDDAGWQVCSQHGPVHGSGTGTARQC